MSHRTQKLLTIFSLQNYFLTGNRNLITEKSGLFPVQAEYMPAVTPFEPDNRLQGPYFTTFVYENKIIISEFSFKVQAALRNLASGRSFLYFDVFVSTLFKIYNNR